mmetsp:Transcript_56369/g.152027  ORF Transcript_56369/g.152027 Transcript_56369/m.152027 type:complete len:429 (+) Transcript_56369:100-1386(+)
MGSREAPRGPRRAADGQAVVRGRVGQRRRDLRWGCAAAAQAGGLRRGAQGVAGGAPRVPCPQHRHGLAAAAAPAVPDRLWPRPVRSRSGAGRARGRRARGGRARALLALLANLLEELGECLREQRVLGLVLQGGHQGLQRLLQVPQALQTDRLPIITFSARRLQRDNILCVPQRAVEAPQPRLRSGPQQQQLLHGAAVVAVRRRLVGGNRDGPGGRGGTGRTGGAVRRGDAHLASPDPLGADVQRLLVAIALRRLPGVLQQPARLVGLLRLGFGRLRLLRRLLQQGRRGGGGRGRRRWRLQLRLLGLLHVGVTRPLLLLRDARPAGASPAHGVDARPGRVSEHLLPGGVPEVEQGRQTVTTAAHAELADLLHPAPQVLRALLGRLRRGSRAVLGRHWLRLQGTLVLAPGGGERRRPLRPRGRVRHGVH